MSLFVTNLGWILEYLMVVICTYAAFGERAKLTLGIVLIGIENHIALLLVNYLGYPEGIAKISLICLLINFCVLNRKQIVASFFRFVIGITFASIIEVIASLFVKFLESFLKLNIILPFLITCISFIMSILLWKIIKQLTENIIVIINKRLMMCITIIGILFFILLIWQYDACGFMNSWVYMLLLLMICLAYFFIIREQRIRYTLKVKEKEVKMNQVYGEAYEELLMEVRKRQHDYKNQLAALYSMGIVANSLEELVQMQGDYVGELKKNSKYDKILTSCNNQILAGYLYNKCIAAEECGIEVEYTIFINSSEFKVPLYEIVELLGIFFTNAIEYLQSGDNKKLVFTLCENETGVQFEIKNPADFMSGEEISLMFKSGYSSKGDNRGLGLPQAKQIIDKYNLELTVVNEKLDNVNWLVFKVGIKHNL